MKTIPPHRLARLALLPLAVAFLLLAGCLEKIIVWSPDATRGAVIYPKQGLMLCDAAGKLSPVLMPEAYRVAWLSDSQRLVVARSQNIGDWAVIQRLLGDEKAAAVVAKAEAAWKIFQGDVSWDSLDHALGVNLVLKARHGDALKAKLSATDWDNLAKETVDVHELVLVRVDGDKLATGQVLYQGLGGVHEIRVAPGDRAVAFTAELDPGYNAGEDKPLRLGVVAMDGAKPATVEEQVNAFPDWTADGRSLVYFKAIGSKNDKEDILLGGLVQRTVIDEHGQVAVAGESKTVGGGLFSQSCRVRCLRDGRILFNASELTLPITGEDYNAEHEQLFAYDPSRQATLVRLVPRSKEPDLPPMLAFYEVSPDEKQVLFGSMNGQVTVLTLATGDVKELQPGVKDKFLQGAPVWRSDGAITLVRRMPDKDGKPPARKNEYVLRQGEQETVLSTGWPDELLDLDSNK